MMLPSLAFMLLAPPPAPATANARLVAASLFKNGFAITQREVEVKGAGTTTVIPIPQGAMGTLWFTPSDGLNLDSVVVENEMVNTAKMPAGSLDAILALNVGRTVTLLVTEAGPPVKVTCKIVSAMGTIVVVETTPGTTRVINKGSIQGLEGKNLKSESSVPFSRRVMRLRTNGKPGTVTIVALERNLSWAPAYAVNLLPGGKELSLVAKATVVNDLERITDLDCRFVTGFPNLPFAQTLDPLVQAVNAINNVSQGGGMGGGFGGGGFGGQSASFENRRGANVGYSSADAAMLQASQTPDGQYLEELFFYRKPNVSVDVSGRAAYTLFRTQTPYESLYTWDMEDPAPGQPRFEARVLPPGAPSPEEVWQTLRFVNNAKVPLTTAPATTFSEGQIVGQDTLKYVSPGQTAELRVTRSLDISADVLEEEIGRERGFVKRSDNYPIYDRVTVKGTLSLTNRKAKAVKVRIRKSFTGEWLSGEGSPDVSTTAQGLRQPNPTGRAEWSLTVDPGATVKLTYSTRLLVGVG